MATQNSLKTEQLILKLGNGATPEVFTAICSINQDRGVQHSSTVTTTPLVDCGNPDAPTVNATDVDELGTTISGTGILNTGDYRDTLLPWYLSGANKNCQLVDNATGANGGGTIQAAFKLTALGKTGSGRRKRVTVSLTLVADGAVTPSTNA